jgi:uncharacterized protein YrzB (UPF0473 family)
MAEILDFESNRFDDEDEYMPDLISLTDDDGKEYKFEILDQIEYNDERYLALRPEYDDPQKMLDDDGELVVLKVIEVGDEEQFEEIEDDDEYEDVTGIFIDRLQDLFDIEEE